MSCRNATAAPLAIERRVRAGAGAIGINVLRFVNEATEMRTGSVLNRELSAAQFQKARVLTGSAYSRSENSYLGKQIQCVAQAYGGRAH